MGGIVTVCVKLSDGMVIELKYVRYVPQLNKNLISVGALEAQGMRGTLTDGVLKMVNGSLIVLNDIRCNNLYYLKGSAVTENLITSEHLDGNSTKLWQMRLEHVGIDSLQALAKQVLLKGATTCNLKFGKRCVLDKKVKSGTAIHHTGGLLDRVYFDVCSLIKTASLGHYRYCLFC